MVLHTSDDIIIHHYHMLHVLFSTYLWHTLVEDPLCYASVWKTAEDSCHDKQGSCCPNDEALVVGCDLGDVESDPDDENLEECGLDDEN